MHYETRICTYIPSSFSIFPSLFANSKSCCGGKSTAAISLPNAGSVKFCGSALQACSFAIAAEVECARKLSAASTLAIAPIIILGWFTQRQLVRGLTFGAVK
jgi:hypothetical protein